LAEASGHLTTALALLTKLPASAEKSRQELELHLALGSVLSTVRGWGSPEMGAAYGRARELCRKMSESELLFPALFGLFTFHQNRGEHHKAHDVAVEVLSSAARRQHAPAELLGHRILGAELVFLGELAAAIPHLERVIASYDPECHAFPGFVPHDTRISSRNFLAWARLFQGQPDRALAYNQQMLILAREVKDPYNLAFALHVSCLFHQVRGARAVVGDQAAELIELAAEQKFPHMLGTGTFFRGWARAAAGQVEQGIVEMRRGLAAKRATGAEIKVPYYLGLIAAADGRPTEAMPLLDGALGTVQRTGERWFEAELHRLRGEMLARTLPTDHARAEASYRKAIEVAQRQSAKWWELRAAISLARLWTQEGKRQNAYELLAPIYGWFTEGFDTADLKDGKALLEGLA
jgi:predicted ATPase